MSNGYKSQQIDRSSISGILQLLQGLSAGNVRKNNEIKSNQDNLLRLINTAQTPEQMKGIQQSLNRISGDSKRYTDTSLGYDLLSNALENKQNQFNTYNEAGTRAMEYIEGDDFWDSSEEFENLNAKAQEMLIDDDGNKVAKYESSHQMISEKYNEVNSLLAQLESGAQSGLNFGNIKSQNTKGKSYNQNDLINTLKTQKNRLDKAMVASINNGEITAEEAALIMGGLNRSEYENEKNTIVREIYQDINMAESGIKSIENIERKLASGAVLEKEERDALDSMGFFDTQVQGQDGTPVTLREMNLSDDELKSRAAQFLMNTKQNFTTNLIGSKKRHYDWTGRGYGGAPYSSSAADVDKPDFIDSDRYDAIVQGMKDEEDAFKAVDEDLLNKSNADLLKRYGTSDVTKIKQIIEDNLEQGAFDDLDKEMEEASNEDLLKKYKTTDPDEIKSQLIKSFALGESYFGEQKIEETDVSAIRRRTEEPKLPEIKKLEDSPTMDIPKDSTLSFNEIIDSNVDNKEAKAIKHFKLDGFKSSLGAVVNKDGSRLKADELAYMKPTEIRSKLMKLKQDRKLKGAPTKEQNDLIKSITKDIATIDSLHKKTNYPKKFKGRGEEPKEITFVKKRLMESYNKLMDDIISNLNKKNISKIKNKVD